MKPICWRAWDGRSESKSCVQDDEAWAGQVQNVFQKDSEIREVKGKDKKANVGPFNEEVGHVQPLCEMSDEIRQRLFSCCLGWDSCYRTSYTWTFQLN